MFVISPPGLVVSNELTNTNVLIQDVFTLLFQVSVNRILGILSRKEIMKMIYHRSTKWCRWKNCTSRIWKFAAWPWDSSFSTTFPISKKLPIGELRIFIYFIVLLFDYWFNLSYLSPGFSTSTERTCPPSNATWKSFAKKASWLTTRNGEHWTALNLNFEKFIKFWKVFLMGYREWWKVPLIVRSYPVFWLVRNIKSC